MRISTTLCQPMITCRVQLCIWLSDWKWISILYNIHDIWYAVILLVSDCEDLTAVLCNIVRQLRIRRNWGSDTWTVSVSGWVLLASCVSQVPCCHWITLHCSRECGRYHNIKRNSCFYLHVSHAAGHVTMLFNKMRWLIWSY